MTPNKDEIRANDWNCNKPLPDYTWRGRRHLWTRPTRPWEFCSSLKTEPTRRRWRTGARRAVKREAEVPAGHKVETRHNESISCSFGTAMSIRVILSAGDTGRQRRQRSLMLNTRHLSDIFRCYPRSPYYIEAHCLLAWHWKPVAFDAYRFSFPRPLCNTLYRFTSEFQARRFVIFDLF